MIVGSVFGEFDFKPVLENRDELTREETMKLLEKCFQEDAKEIAAEFEKAVSKIIGLCECSVGWIIFSVMHRIQRFHYE